MESKGASPAAEMRAAPGGNIVRADVGDTDTTTSPLTGRDLLTAGDNSTKGTTAATVESGDPMASVVETIESGWKTAVQKVEEGVDSVAHAAAKAFHLASAQESTDQTKQAPQEFSAAPTAEAAAFARDRAIGPGAAGGDLLAHNSKPQSLATSIPQAGTHDGSQAEIDSIARDRADGPGAAGGDPLFSSIKQHDTCTGTQNSS